jgi:hypothetical protein
MHYMYKSEKLLFCVEIKYKFSFCPHNMLFSVGYSFSNIILNLLIYKLSILFYFLHKINSDELDMLKEPRKFSLYKISAVLTYPCLIVFHII